VVAALHDLERHGRRAIDQPVLAVDAAGSEASEVSAERLGLAGALEWVAQAFLDQAVELARHRLVVGLPVQARIDSRSLRAFFGLDSR